MKKLKINFKNCYGIKNLKKEFEFSNKTFAIYAPNGAMKTSFAKTFDNYSKNKEATDLVFPERLTTREIIADGKDISPENIFVIEPYNEKYQSEKISTLLANKELKKNYDTIHKDIDKAKFELIKNLKKLSGLSGRKDSVENVIEETFNKNFFETLFEVEDVVLKTDPSSLQDINYQIIFNDKVISFLNTKDFKESTKEYIEKYHELIEKSQYLKKDFNFYHAENIQKQLETNNFFKVGHSVNLFDGSNKNEFSNSEALKNILENEKNEVLDNSDLQKSFEEIDKKLTNTELRNFRSYLLENQDILPELADLSELAKKVWLAYFISQKTLFLDLIKKYKDGQEEVEKLLKLATQETTEWENVVGIFNTRFSHLPFYLNIKNRNDVILKDEVPTVEFVFRDGEEEKIFGNKNELLKILSTGEKRALYILNIIFEVEARKKEATETLFIIDDIADSFDYKNKYAIVEYLKNISEIDKFYMLILTHNFDFFRTIESRGVSSYGQCLITVKNQSEIKLEKAKYLKNPFIKDWKNNLKDTKKLVSSIPFVRNIIEYTQGEDNDDYLLLTSMLHYKDNTENLTISDIEKVFNNNMNNINFPKVNLNKKILDLIFETADECLMASEGINLENKIVLSIAIRLKAEKFMQSKITDTQFLIDLNKRINQTWQLLKRYEEEFNNEEKNIGILKRVNLITPENIHINSFMYEPILDMGDGELRDLYNTVKEL